MKAVPQLYPHGLTVSQFNRLSKYTKTAASISPDKLLAEANRHVDAAVSAYKKNRLINLKLAIAIRDLIATLVSNWDKQIEVARPWLAAAILYFSSAEDEEPDFDSSIGFEDDLEVLNVCLRFAYLDELCLKPEDFDNV